MSRPQHLMMNFWVADFPASVNEWAEDFDPAGMPWYARYDFVEYWEYVPEAERGHYGVTDESPFVKTWTDDFNSFDETRWSKKNNWTFEGNDTTFMES
jgi:hypothetical protein